MTTSHTIVMPALAAKCSQAAQACLRGHPRLACSTFSKQGVDGRDVRVFTQEPVEDGRGRPYVFDGLLPGHDSDPM